MCSLIISPNIGIHEFLDPLLKADQMSYVYANRLSMNNFIMSNLTLRAHVNVSSDIYSQSHGLFVFTALFISIGLLNCGCQAQGT